MSETDNDTIILSDEGSDEDSDAEILEPKTKRRRIDASQNLSFKEKVQNILDTLTDTAPGEFAVSGKLNAPMVTIAIKVTCFLSTCLLCSTNGNSTLNYNFRIQTALFTFHCMKMKLAK